LSESIASKEVGSFARRLAIIHDEIEPSVIATAREWLQDASQVCFIGFGYHPVNLERLRAQALGATGKPLLAGTFLNLERGEIDAIRQAFANRIAEHGYDALNFLRKTSIIHQ